MHEQSRSKRQASDPASTRQQVQAAAELARQLKAANAASASKHMAALIGLTLPRYSVQNVLGRGGQGIVYLAFDKSTDGHVAIKVLNPSAVHDTRALKRFEREVEILQRLDDEGICPVLDHGVEDLIPYVVMTYISGDTLLQRISEARKFQSKYTAPEGAWRALLDDGQTPSSSRARATHTPVHAIVYLAEQLARSIHSAHKQGVIHRDLKPGNIVLRGDGRPVILDFGLALDMSGQYERVTTHDGRLGTPQYMAPEQICGEPFVDHSVDIYATGVLLYELLTLQRPFRGRNDRALEKAILAGKAKSPRRINSAIPRNLQAVCLRAMHPDPNRRYSTSLELADDLRRLRLGRPTMTRPLSPIGRLLRRTRRRRRTR